MPLFRRKTKKQSYDKNRQNSQELQQFQNILNKLFELKKINHPIGLSIYVDAKLGDHINAFTGEYDESEKGDDNLHFAHYKTINFKDGEKIKVGEIPAIYYNSFPMALFGKEDLGEIISIEPKSTAFLNLDTRNESIIVSNIKRMAWRKEEIWEDFKKNPQTGQGIIFFYQILAHPSKQFLSKIKEMLKRYEDVKYTKEDFKDMYLDKYQEINMNFWGVGVKGFNKELKPEDVYIRIVFPALGNYSAVNLPMYMEQMMAGVEMGLVYGVDYVKDMYNFIRNIFKENPDKIYESLDLIVQFHKYTNYKYAQTLEMEINRSMQKLPGMFGVFSFLPLTNSISSFNDITMPVYRYVYKPFFTDNNFLGFLPDDFFQGINIEGIKKEELAKRMLFWVSAISSAAFLGIHSVIRMADLRTNETVLTRENTDKVKEILPYNIYKEKSVNYIKHLLDNIEEMQSEIIKEIVKFPEHVDLCNNKRSEELKIKLAESLFQAADDLYNNNKSAVRKEKENIFAKTKDTEPESYKNFSLHDAIYLFGKDREKNKRIYQDIQRAVMMYIYTPQQLEQYLNTNNSIENIYLCKSLNKFLNPFTSFINNKKKLEINSLNMEL